ncbi:MAG TPA: polyphenol oxidase family protein [Candidatus Polarisedimenticolaceae bacterium]|nr:polyphenol oxidase family protein [Candidatus Polarisedimenticolaceae bacterium]
MSNIFKPTSFKDYPEVVAALSLRDPDQPGEFSMKTTNATVEVVLANRQRFAEMLGFDLPRLAVANQNHTDKVHEITDASEQTEAAQADALITNTPGWLMGVTIADCIAIMLYDPAHRAAGVIHSGRRGTAKNITGKTVTAMQQTYKTDPAKLVAYVSPCPNANEYPIDLETAKEQDERYITPGPNKDTVFYDNRAAACDQLLAAGLQPEHIQIDERSTIAGRQFHSYRRDHETSGRMLAAIALKKA